MAQVLGVIDIGATKVMVGIATKSGMLELDRQHVESTPESPEELLALVSETLTRLLADDTVLAIGCVAPGPIETVTGSITRLHNKGWESVAIAPYLAERFSCPVVLEDDATAAALGEARVGAGAGLNPVAYITVSSGIGAGLVIDGQPYRGRYGNAGEIGHLVIDPDGPMCSCGRRGDIESFAGGKSLARQLNQQWSARSSGELFDVVDLFEGYDRDDAVAVALIESATFALARGIAAIDSLWNPERIIVGGSIALAQPGWIARVGEVARDLSMREVSETSVVSMASLGSLSCLAGAAQLAIHISTNI